MVLLLQIGIIGHLQQPCQTGEGILYADCFWQLLSTPLWYRISSLHRHFCPQACPPFVGPVQWIQCWIVAPGRFYCLSTWWTRSHIRASDRVVAWPDRTSFLSACSTTLRMAVSRPLFQFKYFACNASLKVESTVLKSANVVLWTIWFGKFLLSSQRHFSSRHQDLPIRTLIRYSSRTTV